MASGVSVSKDVKDVYEAMKMKKEHKYCVFRLNPGLTEIIVEKQAAPDATYEDLVQDLLNAVDDKGTAECRYAVMDMPYTKGGIEKSKILFFAWSPDNAKVKNKMLYASSKDALVKDIEAGITKIQANDDGDLDKKAIQDKLMKEDRYDA